MQVSVNSILRKVYGVSKQYIRRMSRESPVCTQGVDPNSRMVWLDMELSGLDIEKDVVLEVACIVTEADLQEVGERFDVVIHQSENILNGMDSWCKETHFKTGLIDAIGKSTVTIQEAENRLLSYIQKYTDPGKCCVAGNTVHMDRFFLMKYFPKVEQHLHYRIVDVSSIKELCRRWNRAAFQAAPQKLFTHRALDDVLESIAELRYYKLVLFDKKTTE